MFSAVVYSAGRTGGHLIVANLSHYFQSSKVKHSHNALIDLPFEDSIAVISKRRNLFDATISMLVASRIDRFYWTAIDTVDIPEFEVLKIDFENLLQFQRIFNQVIDSRLFAKKVILYYEDIIEDSKYLMRQFDIDAPMLDLLKKSPYDARSKIINIDQLRDWYEQLSDRPISEEQIELWKTTITTDLNDIKKNHDGNRFSKKITGSR